VTVNEYESGQGISSHTDTHSAFDDGLVSLSLGSGLVMNFKRRQLKRPGPPIRRAELFPEAPSQRPSCALVAASANEVEKEAHRPAHESSGKVSDDTDRYPLWLPPRSLLILQSESRYKWQHGIASRKFDMVEGERLRRERRLSLTFRKVLFPGERCKCAECHIIG
jgi:alkylated DNA repair protein alkB family protein 8